MSRHRDTGTGGHPIRRRRVPRRAIPRWPGQGRRGDAAEPSVLSARDLLGESLAGVLQRPARSALTALGTVLGVGTFVAILGLTATTSSQIDSRFNALTAAEVNIEDVALEQNEFVRLAFPDDADARVERLAGVEHAGVYWTVDYRGTDATVRSSPVGDAADGERASIVAASPGAIKAAVPHVAEGRVYDNTKGKRARHVPIVEEIRPLVAERILAAGPNPDARLFTGPRGGRISTAVLRDATHRDEVVTALRLEHLRRHDLRHTGLTWFADAGVPAHVLRKIAGHGSLLTTQRYLHPDMSQITNVGTALTAHLNPVRAPLQPRRPARPRTAPLDRVVPKWSPGHTERRYRITPIPPATCENAGRDDRI
ncbi:tyrosine-type recombinase/integrase [Streptomyces uncialis]|uniref:tyrosine-type recombinase/integrase n=1 Tax=Streptomyces uncialis TaxID=1048205 RepID=UPI0037F7229B